MHLRRRRLKLTYFANNDPVLAWCQRNARLTSCPGRVRLKSGALTTNGLTSLRTRNFLGRSTILPAGLAVGQKEGKIMNRIIYIVGLIVIVIAILSFFGLR